MRASGGTCAGSRCRRGCRRSDETDVVIIRGGAEPLTGQAIMAGLQSLYARAELEPVAGNPYVTNGIKYLRIYNLTPAEFDVTVVKADGSERHRSCRQRTRRQACSSTGTRVPGTTRHCSPMSSRGGRAPCVCAGVSSLWVCGTRTTDDLRQMLFIQRR